VVKHVPWRGITAEMVATNASEYVREFYKRTSLWGLKPLKWFRDELGDEELVVTKVSKESPLTIWWEAVSTALVSAMIISGGEVDLVRGKFKLKSLGQGVKELKNALSPPRSRSPSAGSGESTAKKRKAA
jgi:hypothetical protein